MEHHIAAIGSVLSIIPFRLLWKDIRVDSTPRVGSEGEVLLAAVTHRDGVRKPRVQDIDGNPVVLSDGDRIIGTLGYRESTTHLLGRPPLAPLTRGSGLDLLSEGGMVGKVLFIPPSMGEPVALVHEGFLVHRSRILSMKDFAIPEGGVTTLPPMILVAGTSSEIGKTTLTGKIIGLLAGKFGKKVSSVMMSGTGSRADALNHWKAGASHAHSFIETGLNNSYHCSAKHYRCAMRSLLGRIAEEEKPDFIVGELGGDFTWGNNDTILRDRRIMKHVKLIVVIVNDVVGARGTLELFRSWHIEEPPVFGHSWERSYGGMAVRLRELLGQKTLNVNDMASIEQAVRQCLPEGRLGVSGLSRVAAGSFSMV